MYGISMPLSLIGRGKTDKKGRLILDEQTWPWPRDGQRRTFELPTRTRSPVRKSAVGFMRHRTQAAYRRSARAESPPAGKAARPAKFLHQIPCPSVGCFTWFRVGREDSFVLAVEELERNSRDSDVAALVQFQLLAQQACPTASQTIHACSLCR